MKKIEKLIGKPALLEQIAEECTELAKAALKHARILRNENPTPVTEEEVNKDVIEEFTDVVQCARELGLEVNEEQIIRKNARWISRINSQKIGGGQNE